MPQGDDTTDRIRTEAVRLFARAGYGSTTIDDIAAAAEVGVATIYRRWDDKAALANDLYSQFMDDMESLIEQPTGTTAKRRFMEVWDALWAFAHANPDRFIFLEAHAQDGWVNDANRARKSELGEQNSQLMELIGVRAPANVAQAMTMGTVTVMLRSDGAADKHDIGERLWQALRTA